MDKKPSLLGKLKERLARTRDRFSKNIGDLLLGKKQIDAATLEELEEILLTADVGMEATEALLEDLRERLSRRELLDGQAVVNALRNKMVALLEPCEKPPIEVTEKPTVILMVGVNGSGKTTTIGKLTHRFRDQGLRVLLAAGDTFRAAAMEQLQIWGERSQVPVVAHQPNADPAAVIFDALQAAAAQGIDLVLADTSGRLHTQHGLMEELRKIDRVIKKFDPRAPHETLLVLDAGNGQNALQQALEYHKAIGITGIVLTKLDGTARGGILLAIASRLELPIAFIGVGEGIGDLRPFRAEEFVDALMSKDPATATETAAR